jgi:hypothetical protein
MIDSYEFRKIGADKIALLGLFVLALLLAHLTVLSKKAVKLSRPTELHHYGLSISMPEGAGWKTDRKWAYRNNAYQTSSSFAPLSRSAETTITCKYSLAPLNFKSDDWFDQIASGNAAKIIQKDTIVTAQTNQNVTFGCAYLRADNKLLDICLATAELPYGKRLDIELHHYEGDSRLAESIFKKILRSIKLQDKEIFEVSASIVEEIKKSGIENLLETNKSSFFVIENSQKKPVGFTSTLSVISSSSAPFANNEQFNVQIADSHYIREVFPSEHLAIFKCNSDLGRFSYKSETVSPAGRTGHEIVFDPNGIMTVKSFSGRRYLPSVTRLQRGKQQFRPSPIAVPDPLLDEVLIQMLKKDQKTILIEMIDYDGQIIPVLITKKQRPNIPAPESETEAFIIELLDGRGFVQQVYLDSQMQISKALLDYDNKYLLIRSSKEEVLNLFPERAGYMLRKTTPTQPQ